MRHLKLATFAASFALAILAAPANSLENQDLRVAIVIGNSAYPDAPLANPVKDARSMADTLRAMHFEVTEVDDASKAAVVRALEAVRSRIADHRATVLFYFAGHGVQLNWRNYLVPVDANLTTAADAPARAIGISEMLEGFKRAGSKTNILILDACRDNPFSDQSTGKGLAQMDAPTDTFLAYATAPGNVAFDGTGDHGLYTGALLKEMSRSGVKIEDVLKRVRLEVRVQSEGHQIPWESTSLEDDFYFVEPAGASRVKQSDNQKLEAELNAWEKIKDSTTPGDYVGYLQTYPSGFFAETAQFRLDHLQAPKVQVQQTRLITEPNGVEKISEAPPVEHLPSGVNRYHLHDTFEYQNTDHFTGEVHIRKSVVTYADDSRVEFNNGSGVQDQMGNVIRNRFGVKIPFATAAPADLEVGKKWRSAFRSVGPNGELGDVYYDYRVVALESVTVPAGQFMAYRVDGFGYAQMATGASIPHRVSHWVDPKTFFIVKSETKFGDGKRINVWDMEELKSFTPGAQ